MPKRLLYIIVAISIAASVLIAAVNPAKREPVYFNSTSGEITINMKQTAIARFGWLSCSRGMSQDFIDHFVITLELYQDGVLLQTVSTADGYWVQTPVDPNPACVHINEPQTAYWNFEDLSLKKPGTYTVVFHSAWTAALGDGFDANGNGEVDVYPPSELAVREVTINVTP
jgi:hypothetical protein